MITAAFTSGNTLICVIPSASGRGNTLIRVEAHNRQLVITHSCPRSHIAHACECIKVALSCYREWRWWERWDEANILLVNEHITLQPNWEPIPIPNSLEELFSISVLIEGGM